MRREVLGGIGLGVAAFLLYLGYDILPFLLIGILLFVLWQTPAFRGVTSRIFPETAREVESIDFEDIGGQETAKKELLEALDFLADQEAIRRLGIRPLKGILLHGPPGTGKTLLAKAAATYTRSSFVGVAGSEFIEVYAGVGAQRVRELFQRARQLAREEGRRGAIVFIDELEVLGGKRGANHGHLEYDQTLNQLLVEMDGLSPDTDVQILVMGATNRPDLLDDALIRPGRFDRMVKVDLPDRAGRLQILQVHTRNKPLAEGVDLDRVAKETFGFSGAHLENLANEAAILAFREGLDRIEERHFREGIDKVIMGEKLERRPTPEEMRRIAVHEAGHAVVGEILRPESVATITITSRGAALGYVRQAPADDVLLETREHLENDIRIALAGALAEELVLGTRSTGATADYRQAVGAARKMVLAGMSELGIVGEDLVPGRTLHEAVSGLLARQEEEVRDILAKSLPRLERVVAILLERERLEGSELREILRGEAAQWAG